MEKVYYITNKNYNYKRNNYEGDFKDDKNEGEGILIYNNGDRYEGFFKDNKN